VAAPLPWSIPDANRSVIYEFAMDRLEVVAMSDRVRYLTLDRFSSAHRWDTTELHGQKIRLHEGREPIQSAGLGCWETRRRGCARSTKRRPDVSISKGWI